MYDLARQALATNTALLALGNETFEAEGALFVRNTALPIVHDANFVTKVTASTPQEIDRLLARVEKEYLGVPCRRFEVDFTTPSTFEARLALAGYRSNDALVMLLQGELRSGAQLHDIRLVVSDEDWSAYGSLLSEDRREWESKHGRAHNPEVAVSIARAVRMKSPPARVWMAYVEDKAVGYCTSWRGISGVGQVEDLFTHPDFRHRGVATALLHHCVADCRSQGAGPVVIVADPHDTPKDMYAALGWEPVAVKRDYWKDAGPSP